MKNFVGSFKSKLTRFFVSQQGVTASEYAIIAVAMATLLTIVLGDPNSGFLGALNSAFTKIVAATQAVLVER